MKSFGGKCGRAIPTGAATVRFHGRCPSDNQPFAAESAPYRDRNDGPVTARKAIRRPSRRPPFPRASGNLRADPRAPSASSQAERRAACALRDRKRVLWGKSVSVRVDLGGSGIIKKK